jgi:hypothetical protein
VYYLTALHGDEDIAGDEAHPSVLGGMSGPDDIEQFAELDLCERRKVGRGEVAMRQALGCHVVPSLIGKRDSAHRRYTASSVLVVWQLIEGLPLGGGRLPVQILGLPSGARSPRQLSSAASCSLCEWCRSQLTGSPERPEAR